MNPIDEHFKRDLEKVEITPSADLWKAKIAPQIAQKKAAPVLWYRAAAVIILLVGSWFALEFYTAKNKVPTYLPEETNMVISPVILPEVKITPPVIQVETTPVSTPIQPPQKTTRKVLQTKTIAQEYPVLKTNKLELETTTGSDMAAAEVLAKPTEYKIKLSINTEKYVTPLEAEKSENDNFADYAKAQWGNVKKGEKLNAPPKKWFDLPKLALRVEGNPLNVLLPKKTNQ